MSFKIFFHFFPVMIAGNLPPSGFDLLLVEGSFSGLRARYAAPLAVPLH